MTATAGVSVGIGLNSINSPTPASCDSPSPLRLSPPLQLAVPYPPAYPVLQRILLATEAKPTSALLLPRANPPSTSHDSPAIHDSEKCCGYRHCTSGYQ